MFSPRYKTYVLVLMTMVYTVHLFDRGVIALLLQPMKEDLSLSDTQLGLVTGIAFAAFYATAGIPIARWADRGNRVTINALALAAWSIAAASYMFVSNFSQLIVARIIAGIGDAGCKPPTYSLLGDYFPKPGERTRAMYVWDMSGALSGIISFALAGWLSDQFGWRTTFLLLGIPGLALAILFKLTVIEPRVSPHVVRQTAQVLPSMRSVLGVLWARPACRHITFATVTLAMIGAGLWPFFMSFLMRTHGVSATELGLWMGLGAGPAALLALAAGAIIVDRWFSNQEANQLRLTAVATVLSIPCLLLLLFAPSAQLGVLGLVGQIVLTCLFSSPVFAILQRLVPDDMRATAFSAIMLLSNLIGMGIGPLIVGALSDALSSRLGEDALRMAMVTVSVLGLWPAWHYWRAAQTVDQGLSDVLDAPTAVSAMPSLERPA